MAYRSLKLALGETTLERKCRRWFGLALFLLIAGSFWVYGWQTDELVNQRNRDLGKMMVGSAMLEKHAELFTGPTTGGPASGRSGNRSRSLSPEKRAVVEHFKEVFRSKPFNWYAIAPENEADINPPGDEFEWALYDRWKDAGRDVLEKLNEDEPADSFTQSSAVPFAERSLSVDDARKYRYYEPVFARAGSAACVGCHRIDGTLPRINLQEGDLIAIMRIEFDEAETVAAQQLNRAILLTAAVVTSVLAMFALYIIVRYVIVKPLKHLRDVSNAVREGDVEQRAEIKTGDEFEELADAFNRMVRQLLSQQDKLREMNLALDENVDELAQANMRLFEMNRLKGDFLSTVSHELRTPLNSIIGFSDVLTNVASLDPKQRRYAENIRRSGRVLLEMINDILDLAKIESGKLEPRVGELRIDTVVSAVCDFARPLSEKKRIALDCEIQPNLPPLLQDQGKIQQILNNLLSNAIKFTPEGGRISVSVRRDENDDLILRVRDTGVGISEDEKKAIFEKFRQGTNALPGGDAMTREYSGTGLGLSIVKELCRLLNGDVAVNSQLGTGSTFSVRLPWKLTRHSSFNTEFTSEVDELAHRHPVDLPTASVGS